MGEAKSMDLGKSKRESSAEEELYRASQWKLMFWRLKRHKLSLAGGATLAFLYLIALMAPFIAPYDPHQRSSYLYLPPQRVHFLDPEQSGLHPFIYGLEKERNPKTYGLEYAEDPSKKHRLRVFCRGSKYKVFGPILADIHLFGVDGDAQVFLWGTDALGRDVFSRCVRASSISLSVGLVGIALSFILGTSLGGISGYFGGAVDTAIQQTVILLSSLPTLPLWMGLSAAVPTDWPPVQVYLGITVILSLVGWTGLARIIRGLILQLKDEEFVAAARLSGVRNYEIIFSHLLPSCMSYMIVSLTLSVPGMILGETALSFLGLGLKEPVVSWGVLLKDAQNVRTVSLYPWLMIPALAVIVTALSFNFLGDGLRDAADPYG